ncbi:MAG: hypothetical protein A2186_01330 [Candidatus Levybacteria bacterium RIFOXYA1_FULL_41_10]|nr:MAG: hypothetical protein UT46_C0002G0019 [Candidatus Levybacteria bacterium GW2011_GWA1_39_34]KKR51635.1 MAG: hypothetical protein UT87_C0002G0016 [Candidatus Levybacteria bacterium GW2011_GWC1_40_19]KKR72406.1 MAG: hypothetical protein UU15_C0029G0013 [Candidatus Levybacteria bacterium GW2011_GWC2_40_7]KKR95485.1 MAG: hypothetical protein UU45_C0001G0080 [Candidatus Levybacteria bacterium GW2011_GWA2_41_15]KKS02432.1 MAG: hypothetical protein UU52_C0001G0016 [Candidatus Levybacteria bacter
MKELINKLRLNRSLSRFYFGTIIVLIIAFLYGVLSFRSLPPIIPLFNQLPWGEQRFSPSIGIFLPVGIALGITIFNFVFSSVIYKTIPLISRMLAVTTFLISILTLLFTIRTIQLVI